jgi:hypothetical protein
MEKKQKENTPQNIQGLAALPPFLTALVVSKMTKSCTYQLAGSKMTPNPEDSRVLMHTKHITDPDKHQQEGEHKHMVKPPPTSVLARLVT